MVLTPTQLEILGKVCRTNGGGYHAGFHEGARETKIIRALERKGLVQGKAGQPSRAVHTAEGLALYRATHPTQQAEEK